MKSFHRFGIMVAIAAILPLAACSSGGGQGDNVADQVTDPAQSESVVQSILDKIPEQYKPDVEQRFARFRQDLEQRYSQADKLENVKRDRALANLADYIVRERRNYNQRVEQNQRDVNEREARNDTINIDSARSLLAEVQLQVAALDQLMAKIRTSSPFANEAAKRLLASLDDTGRPSANMYYIIREVEGQPCLLMKGHGAKATPFSMRGIELGMNREAALAAICEAQNNDVRLLNEAQAVTFGDQNRLERGAQLTAMEDYRAGRGSFDQNFSKARSLLNGPVQQRVQSENRKEYLSVTNLCVGCEPGIDYNVTRVSYLPNGQVYKLGRDANFVTTVDENGIKAHRDVPQALKAILGPLERQYGKPSFHYGGAGEAIYGWVFLDRKSPLPLEEWRSFQRVVKPGWGGFSVPEILLNGSSIMTAANVPSLQKLSERPPSATYCLVNSGLLTSTLFGNMALGAVTYGGPARKWGGETQILVNGKPVTSIPYSRTMEGAGYVPKCGIVVQAVLKYARNTASPDPKAALSQDQLIQSVDITILDVDQDQGYAKYETRKILDLQKTVETSLDKAAASTSFEP